MTKCVKLFKIKYSSFNLKQLRGGNYYLTKINLSSPSENMYLYINPISSNYNKMDY